MNRAFDWKFWAGLVVSAVFLYIALGMVDLARLREVIRSATWPSLAGAVGVVLLQYPLRALRWGVLLAPVKPTSFRNRFLAMLIGFAANCLLPARLGEFIRANYLGTSEELSMSSALGTVVVERLFDGLTLLAVLVAGLFVTEFPSAYRGYETGLQTASLGLLAAYTLLILLLAGFKWKAETCLKLLDRILFFLPKRFRSRITEAGWNFSLGIVLLDGATGWIAAALYSCAVWGLALAQIQLVSLSLGLSLPPGSTFLVLALTSLGVMIPSSPGFFGTFHVAAQLGFMIHGFTPEEGLSAGILLHASFFLPTVAAGTAAFLSTHIPWKRLVPEEEARQHPAGS